MSLLTPLRAASGDAFLGLEPDGEPLELEGLRGFVQARLAAAAEDILREVTRYLHRERRQQGGVVMKEEPLGVSGEFQQDLTWIKTCPEEAFTSNLHPAHTHSLDTSLEQPFPLYVIPVQENLAGDLEEEIQESEPGGSQEDQHQSLDLLGSEQLQGVVDSEQLEGVVDSEQLEGVVDSEQLEGLLECKGCGREFQRRLALLNHSEACHPEVCGLCGKSLGPRDIKDHLQVHREALFRCKVCGLTFTLKGNLVSHMKIHLGLRPFHCDVCGKNFRRNCHLVRHKLYHTGEKPYSCSVCGRSYRDKTILKIHLRTHQKDNAPVSDD